MRPLVFMLALGPLAWADGTTLRIATLAPDGTAWAREVRAFERDLEGLTNGGLKTKWYWGGIAGDELAVIDRIRRGQLDGTAASMPCDRLGPSLRVTRLIGLYRNHDEVLYALNRLKERVENEFQKHGFVLLGLGGGFGETVFFSREPMRNLNDLHHTRLWVWDLDDVPLMQLTTMGVRTVPTKVEDAGRAYDDKKHDAFLAIPSAALAFQWSTQARYFTNLSANFLPACFLVSATAFDALPLDQQKALRQASAKLVARFDDVGRAQDDKLLNGLFERQGLTRVQVANGFVNDFSSAANSAREKLGSQLIQTELLQTVIGWLDEYRAAHKSK